MVLEIALSIGARLVILQEPFIGNRELAHSAFNIYWLQRNKTTIRVMIVVRNDLLDKIVVEYRTNLVNHSYFILLKVRNLDLSKQPGRKTGVLNVYDNQMK